MTLLFAPIMAGSALASHVIDISDEMLGRFVLQAEFIIEGRVTAIDYRLSDKLSPRDTVLPNTFVIYEVIRTLKGLGNRGTVTLRFIGGPDGRGRYLTVSNVPTLKKGDHDILFVARNGENPCALVGCIQSRLRIFEGTLYDAKGFPIYLDKNGTMRRGSRAEGTLTVGRFPQSLPEGQLHPDEEGNIRFGPRFDEPKGAVPEDRADNVTVPSTGSPDAPGRAGGGGGNNPVEFSQLSIADFLTLLEDRIERHQGGGVRGTELNSVDINLPFSVRAPAPAAPPATASNSPPPPRQ